MAETEHRPTRRPARPVVEDFQARAAELRQLGLSPSFAMAVARGLLGLSEAVSRMAQSEKATRLEERHSLPRSVAMQVALGQASLEDVLRRRRFEEHRAQNRSRTGFIAGSPLCFGLLGGERPSGLLVSVEPYELTLRLDSGVDQALRKLTVKYVHAATDLKRVRKVSRVDRSKPIGSSTAAERPQDRLPLSDKRLFDWMDGVAEVEMVFLDGESFRGRVLWLSRFEFGFGLKGDVELAVCRHALFAIATD